MRMDVRSVDRTRDVQARSGDVAAGAERTRRAAQPMQRVTSAEKTTGGPGKYFQVRAKPSNSRQKNVQGSEPVAAGFLRANSPKCHATKAANTKYTVAKSPNPR